MSPAAARQRLHRQRESAGLVVLQVELPALDFACALEQERLIEPAMADDKRVLANAVEALIQAWIARVTRHSTF